METRVYYFITLTLALGILMLVLFNLVTIFEKNPLEYTNDPFPTEGAVEAGDFVSFQVSYCLRGGNDLKSDFTLFLVPFDNESQTIATGGDSVTHLSGCHTVQSISQRIPDGTAPGSYKFRYNVFTPGIFRTHRQVVETVPFEVLPADSVPNEPPAGRLVPITPRTSLPSPIHNLNERTEVTVFVNPEPTQTESPSSQPTPEPEKTQQPTPTPQQTPEPTPSPTPVQNIIDRVIDALPSLPNLSL